MNNICMFADLRFFYDEKKEVNELVIWKKKPNKTWLFFVMELLHTLKNYIVKLQISAES